MVLVIDNGGAYLRVGTGGSANPRSVSTNAIARGKKDKKLYVGDKIASTLAYILYRPMNRGVVEDWESEKLVWQTHLKAKDETSVVVTICAFAPAVAKKDMYEVLFNDFKFERVLVLESSLAAQFSPGITAQFTPDDWANPCGLLVDVGFSGCVVIPVFQTQPVPGSAVRLPVGGRVLNNILRERLAYSQVDLDDNPLLVQHIRESVCHFDNDEKISYQLPEYNYFGKVVESGGIQIAGDRRAVPEALFSPLSFGIDKMGITECIELAISKCPENMRSAVRKKIILFGGLAMSPGFTQRLSASLFSCRILTEADGRTDLSVWRGTASLTREEDLVALGIMTRNEWNMI